jgi:uncharacterized membrane protein YdcZ (DUF606 family)
MYSSLWPVRTACVAAPIIDHYRLLGMPNDAVTVKRALGIALVVAGVIVLRA